MPTQKIKQNKLTAWLLTRPLLFAAMMLGATLVCGTLAALVPTPAARIATSALFLIAALASVIITLRGLPAANLDRRSFVTVCTAQTLVLDASILVLPLLFGAGTHSWLMSKIATLAIQSMMLFTILMCIVAFVSMYVTGLALSAFYARYRRIRAMGVTMWRAVLTLPFGFFMLWMPGYLLPDDTQKTPALTTNVRWFNRVIDWLMARPINAAIVFVIQFVLFGLALGAYNTILSSGLMILFAIWLTVAGADKTRRDIPGIYGTVAIAINILCIICAVGIMIAHGNGLI